MIIWPLVNYLGKIQTRVVHNLILILYVKISTHRATEISHGSGTLCLWGIVKQQWDLSVAGLCGRLQDWLLLLGLWFPVWWCYLYSPTCSCDYDAVHDKYLRVRKMLMSFPPTSRTVNFRQVSFSCSCLVLGILLYTYCFIWCIENLWGFKSCANVIS